MKRYHLEYDLRGCQSPDRSLTYQKYLLYGFKNLNHVKLTINPLFVHQHFLLSEKFGLEKRGIKLLWKKLRATDWSPCADDVGRYKIYDTKTGVSCNVAVDSSDGWQVRDHNVLQWSDVYFKNNYWPSRNYTSKVRPLLNGDGLLPRKLYKYLKNYRGSDKTLDLVYITKIWRPQLSEYFTELRIRNIVEHQVRLYEALSKVNCKKHLGVESFQNLNGINSEPFMKRLSDAGVEFYERLPSEKFWALQGTSKILFARPGDHLCISFRICSYLMAGACIVYDGEPFVQWYEPLLPSIHYIHSNCGVAEQYELPDKERYSQIIDVIENLLKNREQMEFLRRNAQQYFDRYAKPEAVTAHILNQSMNFIDQNFDSTATICGESTATSEAT